MFSHLPKLKEQLQINIELAKPTDFVPSLPGESTRHVMIGTFGKATFMHFDPYGQAFSKIVRGHETDIADTKALVAARLVDAKALCTLVKQLPDREFERYPRLTRRAVEEVVESFTNI